MLRWPGLRLAAYAALLALAQGLIFALGHPIVHPADARVRYHSSVLPGLAAAVVQTVLRLILLPWEAVVNASAIVTALWRMTVSHRDLLQWQTAAQRAAKSAVTVRGSRLPSRSRTPGALRQTPSIRSLSVGVPGRSRP